MDLVKGSLDHVQTILDEQQNRITALETKSFTDMNTLVDKVVAQLKPMIEETVKSVNDMTITVGICVNEITAVVQRFDGATLSASVKLTLSPVPEMSTNPAMTVREN